MNIILYIVGFVSLLILLWQLSNLVSVFFGSPYVKTDSRVIIEALKLARIKKGDNFYDLGCGNGDALIEAARYGAQATGFEISPFYFLWARLRTFRDKNIQIKFQNIKNVDIERADIIYCYLLPKMLEELVPKFKIELKSGCQIISIGFPVKLVFKFKKINLLSHTVYIYKS